MKKKKRSKKTVAKPLFQWCIDNTYVNEVLDLPSELDIDSITFEIGFSLKRVASTVPTQLKKLGVTSVREPSASVEANGTLHGTRETLKKTSREICRLLTLDHRHMRVRRLILSYKGTLAFFTRMTKNMDTGEENKSYRTKVLGLVKYEGDEKTMDKIIKILTAKKIKCVYSVKTVTEVLCSE